MLASFSRGVEECRKHPCLLTLPKERENAVDFCVPTPARKWGIALTALALRPQKGSETVLRLIALPVQVSELESAVSEQACLCQQGR